MTQQDNDKNKGGQRDNRMTVDGATAATYVAYALSDIATVYPITPIAAMGEVAAKWAMQGRENYAGRQLQVKEMESELGAAGATHGALSAGALATTFTSSQGLMLMIPNMYKIAGELLPGVFHVGTRSLATHALSIFGDHQDVMACRATGFAFLASSSVQETMDLAVVAHLASLEGSIPVCHFFDGWRTANETDTITPIAYEDMYKLLNKDALQKFRERRLNPERPILRGSAQNADVYFQNREAANKLYAAFPGVVQKYMDKVGALTGRNYHLFDYVGDPEATDVIVVIASAGEVTEQTLEVLNTQGYKGGVVKVRLYRPFDAEALLQAIPTSAKRLTVLDRTKEPGADGEPLYKDVATAVARSGREIQLFGGRFGLSSKEFDPAMVKSIYDNMLSENPLREFTVGIIDDVTHLSLEVKPFAMLRPKHTVQAKFYGYGSDGTVGATKQVAKVMSETYGLNAQAYFQYSAKKSGGYTISQLRLSPLPIKAAYSIEQADYVACHKQTYVQKYALAETLREGGTFVLNSPWNSAEAWEENLPSELRKALCDKRAKCYNIDAAAIAAKSGLGVRINMIMEAAFLYTGLQDFDIEKALECLKAEIQTSYIHEGQDVVEKNLNALTSVKEAITPVSLTTPAEEVPEKAVSKKYDNALMRFVDVIANPCNRLEGNKLPVSVFSADGSMPPGSTAYEKRRIALRIPEWDSQKCIQCTLCSFVCAHAAIRPYLLDEGQLKNAPEGMDIAEAKGVKEPLHWRIQVFSEDCTGCGSCATVCPGHALAMVSSEGVMDGQIPYTKYCIEHVGYRPDLFPRFTVKGSQMYQPLLQFSGACAGCGETPYVKLLTQLFGENMIIANATGCSSIWGADYPSNAYCVNSQGRGPAWANSLFEDNAEFGYGMAVARDILQPEKTEKPVSVWAIGGDGWAYDIGFAGLDHVLARNTKINIFVMDTECYSNTGGQMSKATPISCVAKYAPNGKRTYKKDLGRMMMTYGNVYVASVAMGANPQQAVNAFKEADAYPGPSIVIGYCPCINHGIRAGMGTAMIEERRAVQSGYWPLYRYNPALSAEGKNPLILDSTPLDESLKSGSPLDVFLQGESRYEQLRERDPKLAEELQQKLAARDTAITAELKSESDKK